MVKKVQGNKDPISCKRDNCITGIKMNELFNGLKLALFWNPSFFTYLVIKLKKTPPNTYQIIFIYLRRDQLQNQGTSYRVSSETCTTWTTGGSCRNYPGVIPSGSHYSVVCKMNVSLILAKARISVLCLMRKTLEYTGEWYLATWD